jgi:hypothetical protein
MRHLTEGIVMGSFMSFVCVSEQRTVIGTWLDVNLLNKLAVDPCQLELSEHTYHPDTVRSRTCISEKSN